MILLQSTRLMITTSSTVKTPRILSKAHYLSYFANSFRKTIRADKHYFKEQLYWEPAPQVSKRVPTWACSNQHKMNDIFKTLIEEGIVKQGVSAQTLNRKVKEGIKKLDEVELEYKRMAQGLTLLPQGLKSKI